ncbi:hypothetical protein [Phaeobacter piscinae]|uniref:hypothetical protein n=1 Tax=Phaeobacter piscinae TaxID=1580596 RepID=UPI000F4AA4FA|nr:hypothetical protein [Phaeobacter piscinae]
MKNVVLVALLALTVSACQSTETTQIGTRPQTTLQQSAHAQPGSQSVSPAIATAMFSKMCGGDRSNVATQAAKLGFVQHSTFKTYYHPKLNLSVKLRDGECSMVFASDENPQKLHQAFRANESQIGKTTFRPSLIATSTPHYNVHVGNS